MKTYRMGINELTGWVVFVASCLFWLIPGHPSLTPGSQGFLDPLNLFVITLLSAYLFLMSWPKWNSEKENKYIIAAAIFLGSLMVSFAAYVASPQYGLAARYYPNEHLSPPLSRFYFKSSQDQTSRIDQKINFSSKGFSFFEQTFPLYFSNDTELRAWSPNLDEDPAQFRFSANWSGYIIFEEPVSQLSIEYSGGSLSWFLRGKKIDGQVLPVDHLLPGLHPIEIQFQRNETMLPKLRLKWTVDGSEQVVPKEHLVPSKGEFNSLGYFYALFAKAALLFWVFGNFFVLIFIRPQLKIASWKAIYWFAFLLLSFLIVLKSETIGLPFDANILSAGNDDLTYESSARDLLLGQWWEKNQGKLLYQNLAYPYLLAGMHVIAGEAVGQALWLQQSILIFFVLIATWMVQRLYGVKVALLFFLFLLLIDIFRYSNKMLLDTTFGIAFSIVSVLLLLQYSRKPSFRVLLGSALALAFACLVRANFLPFFLMALGWIWLKSPSRKFAIRALLLFLLTFSICMSTITARNYVVAGSINFMPTSGSLNLWLGNHPPEFDGPTYYTARIPNGVDSLSAAAVDYIIDEPLAFLSRAAQKLAYIFGINIEKKSIKLRVFLLWVLAIFSTVWLIRLGLWKDEYLLLWGWVAAVNLPLIIIFPWGYGWRLSAPSFLMLTLIVAIALVSVYEHKVVRTDSRP